MRRTRIEHMSAGLPPITDIGRRGWHGRKVPEPAVSRCSEQTHYSVTSSAVASNVIGGSKPNALAGLRIIAIPNLGGCSIRWAVGLGPPAEGHGRSENERPASPDWRAR